MLYCYCSSKWGLLDVEEKVNSRQYSFGQLQAARQAQTGNCTEKCCLNKQAMESQAGSRTNCCNMQHTTVPECYECCLKKRAKEANRTGMLL